MNIYNADGSQAEMCGNGIRCVANYRVRESDLQQILEEYGVVDSVKIIVDRDTKRSKGFAFAEMPNAAEAQKAIEELNQAEYEGRQMVVKEAIPRR